MTTVKYLSKNNELKIYRYKNYYISKKAQPNYINPRANPNKRYSRINKKRLLHKYNAQCQICKSQTKLVIYYPDKDTTTTAMLLCRICYGKEISKKSNLKTHNPSEFIKLHNMGYSYQKIGNMFQLSRQRIHKIVQRELNNNGHSTIEDNNA